MRRRERDAALIRPRQRLAELLTSPDNRAFAVNAANRFWFQMMGRGIGHPAGQPEVDFRPLVEQSLFLTNDRLIAAWLAPEAGGTIDRVASLEDGPAVEETFLRILSRLPSEDERGEAIAFLVAASDRREGIADLCRVLLTSAEFRLNH